MAPSAWSFWSFLVLMALWSPSARFSTCQTLPANGSSPFSPPQNLVQRFRTPSASLPAKSGSILEHIDKDQVERYLDQLRTNQSLHQRLPTTRRSSPSPESLPPANSPGSNPKLTIYEPLAPGGGSTPTNVLKIRHSNHRNRHKATNHPGSQEDYHNNKDSNHGLKGGKLNRSEPILQSSKDALFVTRKEYLRSDWCKTQPLLQRISEEGCLSYTFLNRFCYGQCNSFFIPKNIRPSISSASAPRRAQPLAGEGARLGQQQQDSAAFRSCAFCKPKKTSWVTVTLKCPSLTPPYRRRRVQSIKQCRCITEVLT